MKKISSLLFLFISLLFSISGFTQYDTLRLMYYNVLDYPNSDPGREVYFRTLNQFVQADVICVNELKTSTGANLILNDALNVYGVDYYQKANYISGDFSENLIYFNSNKLGLVSQDVIYTDLRDINEYVLYYKSVDLAVTQDTVNFYFYIAHLKANIGFEQQRLDEVNDFLAHLNALPNPENVFFGGDFNLYTSSEPAYQAIINNTPINLNDPLSAGNWHNNSSYSYLHTQSTRTVDFGGGSTGGLDDRFDFITFTDDVLNGSNKVKYVTGSCEAFGNDGNHLNKDLIDPPAHPNIPDSVIQALYYGSDHLPVICDLRVEAVSGQTDSKMMITEIMYNPPEIGLDTLEYMELYNAGTVVENLAGFYFEQGINFTFPAVDVNPGGFIVLALNVQAVDQTFGTSAYQWTSGGLSNGSELLLLKDNFGRTVDSVHYDDSAPWPSLADGDGHAIILCDPQTDNSDPANWEISTNFITLNASNDSIFGSPGINECGLPPIADFVANITSISAGEMISFNDLSLNEPASWNWTFAGGTPINSSFQNPVVTYDTPGIYSVSLMVSNEQGSDTEVKLDYISVIDNTGNLIITEVMNNPAAVSDANGEWFEVFNPGNSPIDMNGWTIKDDDSDSHLISGSLIVPAKGFAVLGNNDNTASNGGYLCNYTFSDFYLANGGDELEILRPDNSQADKISWDGGPGWPDLSGISMIFTGTITDDNNNPTNWVASTLRENSFTGASGDLGSPGTNGTGQNLIMPSFELNLKVFLEGPYNGGSNMSTELIGLSDFPLSQPYSAAPWNYGGFESVVSLPSFEIVDWILVDLRDATSAELADNTSRIAVAAGFVLSNGQVVDLDGTSDLYFESAIENNLFVAIHHRNHLSVLSANPLVETGGIYYYDFTTSLSQAYGNGQVPIGDGIFGMPAGDANADGIVNETDKTAMWDASAGNMQYDPADLNLNGNIDNMDKNDFWYPNQGLGSQVPD